MIEIQSDKKGGAAPLFFIQNKRISYIINKMIFKRVTRPEILRDEKGFSLLEVLLVIGVGSILLFAGMGTYNMATESYKVSDAKRTVASLKQRVQNLFSGQTTYGSNVDLTQVSLNADLFPTTALDGGGDPITPWDTGIEIIGKGDQFYVKILDLDKKPCIYMATLDFSNDDDYVMTGTTGGAGNTGDVTVMGVIGTVPSAAVADGVCNDTGNNLGFLFY